MERFRSYAQKQPGHVIGEQCNTCLTSQIPTNLTRNRTNGSVSMAKQARTSIYVVGCPKTSKISNFRHRNQFSTETLKRFRSHAQKPTGHYNRPTVSVGFKTFSRAQVLTLYYCCVFCLTDLQTIIRIVKS